MKEALYYTYEEDKIKCHLCPHYCLLAEGQNGRCQVRKVEDNRLITITYNQVSAVALDPIEKKPLFHFYPGSQILSLGTVGCNLKCKFCQNHNIVHDTESRTETITPKEAVHLALDYNSIGIAYTYSEPLVWYEYILETAQLAYQKGLKNVLVTNGMINPEPLKELLPYIDAVNLDVKAFTEDFYREICKGSLNPVKRTAELVYQDILLEITTLLIPGLNDSEEEIKELVDWIATLDISIPLHFSRYFPQYQLDIPPTSIDSLIRAKEIADKKLDYVYLGNVEGQEYRNTYCPKCNKEVISRNYNSVQINLDGKSCSNCGQEIKVIL
ncbi:AmmeMemoRadiSam system radical SAM enzyme [Orenia metallireducens]|uniref:AmmeMemoRadiSam system radical SAM enzyme n=1 Tax=Orenia metallireducens TaxID=1413210 RepID=A0A1C0ABQ1_9FIRM|nr:AmmeMemoRadiSam system radical SAM enzyme [Orenia metallireducens]OCL27803.1 AmmeMemoRadiSam system radical SAM enzyme [Orenia metallireducens]